MFSNSLSRFPVKYLRKTPPIKEVFIGGVQPGNIALQYVRVYGYVDDRDVNAAINILMKVPCCAVFDDAAGQWVSFGFSS
ncbi:hypothetical protein [Coleofasciculus sp. D1-CHI-01]|uniref:hypothetical protein n=1 Tax=Coleofasciculus sp. D1-CHI-01 TaxID=3068482 RepID=UPI004064C766